MSESSRALEQARWSHGEIGEGLRRALDADINADSTSVRRYLRDALKSHGDQDSALYTLEHDPAINPNAAMGAQVSDGQSDGSTSGGGRSLDPEVRRQQDQLRSIEICHRERLRQMGRTR